MSGRPLLAARGSSAGEGRDGPDHTSPAPKRSGGRAKRTLIESACSACRRRKSRCDGQRPTCSRCQNLRTECQYEAEEGESRWSALRRRNQVLEIERDQLRDLLAFVQTRPEPEALDIFARIRQTPYDDLFLLLRQIKDGALGMNQALAPYPGAPPPASMSPGAPTGPDHRLPPIQTILNVGGNTSNRDVPHPTLQHSQSLSSEESRGSHGSMDGNVGSSTPHTHRLLDTLEPSLRGNTNAPPVGTPQLTLSSEESMGSINSTMDASPKPYHIP